MALFDEDRARPEQRRPGSRARTAGWWLLAIAVVIAGVFASSPAPYVIEQPGPVYDTLGVATTSDGDEVPLISVPDETTYPTEGNLDLLTVSIVGNPQRQPSWLEIGGAMLDDSRAVVPIEAVFPADLTQEERDEQNQTLMVDSQQDAIAAALVELGYDFPREVTIIGLLDDSAAEGQLEEGDVITAVNGEPMHDIASLRDAIQVNGAEPADIEVDRDGETVDAVVTPRDQDGTLLIGVGVTMQYEFPIDVQIQLDDVGGPSAGLMFALGIIDKLTPDAMTGGERIAGTGTIDSAGNVGPIGGIRQKMHGAVGAGADWMLAPASNCDEVVGNIPSGLEVFAVQTLDDAIDAIDVIAQGGDLDALPRCAAG
ncbi:YlbL family protein [Agromyces sp. SYSU T00194]|uniref:YlbL family protein n=1 Tax=Agromyces chitinivorans TaxID=3158560 RepID=UPI0033928D79